MTLTEWLLMTAEHDLRHKSHVHSRDSNADTQDLHILLCSSSVLLSLVNVYNSLLHTQGLDAKPFKVGHSHIPVGYILKPSGK